MQILCAAAAGAHRVEPGVGPTPGVRGFVGAARGGPMAVSPVACYLDLTTTITSLGTAMNRCLSSFRRVLSVAAIAFGTLASLPVQAGPFGTMFVFGDSLSDNGNNAIAGLYDPFQVITGNSYIPSSTYASATYSNGPVWATYYAAMIGVPLAPSLAGGGDYAFGGATTGTPGPGQGGFPYSLRTQADMYLAHTGGVASADALYVVAGGGNNARAALAAIAAQPGNAGAIIAAAAAAFANDIGIIVDELQAAGAQHIVVWDAPNLGLAPAVTAAGPTASATSSFLAGVMNGALAARLNGEAGVSIFDLFGFNTTLVTNPGVFGLTNGTDACGAIVGADCSQYAYWDGIHPTTAGHAALANAMFAATIPEPETYVLLTLGLIAVVWQTRRRAQPALRRA